MRLLGQKLKNALLLYLSTWGLFVYSEFFLPFCGLAAAALDFYHPWLAGSPPPV